MEGCGGGGMGWWSGGGMEGWSGGVEAVGLLEGQFLGEEEGGGGVDAGAPGVADHVVEGHVGEGGGFAALAFPEEGEEAVLAGGEGGESGGLVGAHRKG